MTTKQAPTDPPANAPHTRYVPELRDGPVHISVFADKPHNDKWGRLSGLVFINEAGDCSYEVAIGPKPTPDLIKDFPAQMLTPRDGIYKTRCECGHTMLGLAEGSTGLCGRCEAKYRNREGAA